MNVLEGCISESIICNFDYTTTIDEIRILGKKWNFHKTDVNGTSFDPYEFDSLLRIHNTISQLSNSLPILPLISTTGYRSGSIMQGSFIGEMKMDVLNKEELNKKLSERTERDPKKQIELTVKDNKLVNIKMSASFEIVLENKGLMIVRPMNYDSMIVAGTALRNCIKMDHHLCKYNPDGLFFVVSKNMILQKTFKICIYLNYEELDNGDSLEEKDCEIAFSGNDEFLRNKDLDCLIGEFLKKEFDYKLEDFYRYAKVDENG